MNVVLSVIHVFYLNMLQHVPFVGAWKLFCIFIEMTCLLMVGHLATISFCFDRPPLVLHSVTVRGKITQISAPICSFNELSVCHLFIRCHYFRFITLIPTTFMKYDLILKYAHKLPMIFTGSVQKSIISFQQKFSLQSMWNQFIQFMTDFKHSIFQI